MSYLDNEKFEEKGQKLIFNKGEAGVVENCRVAVGRRSSEDSERAPIYKIIVEDLAQQANNDPEVLSYPVNKGYFYQDNFKSDGAEKYAVNELKHLQKVFGHKVNGNDLIYTVEFKDYNDFLDYTFKFINESLKNDKGQIFNVAVDYGNGNYPNDFLRLNGYPWYINIAGIAVQNKQDAIMKRPVKNSEEESDATKSKNSESDWLND